MFQTAQQNLKHFFHLEEPDTGKLAPAGIQVYVRRNGKYYAVVYWLHNSQADPVHTTIDYARGSDAATYALDFCLHNGYLPRQKDAFYLANCWLFSPDDILNPVAYRYLSGYIQVLHPDGRGWRKYREYDPEWGELEDFELANWRE